MPKSPCQAEGFHQVWCATWGSSSLLSGSCSFAFFGYLIANQTRKSPIPPTRRFDGISERGDRTRFVGLCVPSWRPSAMLPTTPERVPAHTSEPGNRSIRDEIAGSVRWHSRHPERIDRRLHELDEEWDIERTLEANAATLALTGSVLGIFVDKRFRAVPVVVTAF